MEKVKFQLGFRSVFVVPSTGNIGLSGGLAFLWDDSVDVRLLSYSKYHIDMEIKHQELMERFRLTGFYDDPVLQNRRAHFTISLPPVTTTVNLWW